MAGHDPEALIRDTRTAPLSIGFVPDAVIDMADGLKDGANEAGAATSRKEMISALIFRAHVQLGSDPKALLQAVMDYRTAKIGDITPPATD
jgi:hypothetical protein